MPNTDMHVGNMPHNNRPYPENEETFPVDHHRNNEMPHETWRTYDDVHPEEMNVVPNNDMNPENGTFHHNPEIRHGFEPHNNLSHQNRGRPERFPPHSGRGEEEFRPDNMPPRSGQPPYDDRFHGDEDLRNNHMGPPGSGSEEMDFMPHKRSWNDGPNREEHYPPMDYDGPQGPPPNFNPRQHMRPNFRGHRGGPRGSYRGMRSSPYRVVNRGRGRGGYS